MFLRGKVLAFITNILGTFCLVKRNVLYTGPAITGTNKISCAAEMSDPSILAARTEDVTGSCQGLNWDGWGTSPQYEAGYTYLEKKTTEESYDPPILLQGTTLWLIPGTFGNGGRLDVYFTPTADSASYSIKIMDVTAETFDVYKDDPESIMVNMEIYRDSNVVLFKTWTPEQWWVNHGSDSPFPFSEGTTSKISVVPDASSITVFFDDRQVTSYAHPYDSHPNEAKQLRFEMCGGCAIEINSIVFVGV